ncbi:MAG: DUF502 domain-containing protein [Mariniblastus sp.]|nr:DUF502 domain-containing protein [Mariniblastus sp.]MDG2180451.1 DUF502 domain-containing protein [Mariniblastus sp.]
MNSEDKSTRKKSAVKQSNKKNPPPKAGWFRRSFNPFRIATLRGLGILLPPLLTIMLFAWAWNTIERAILLPVESLSETALAYAIEDIRTDSMIEVETNELENVQDRFKSGPQGKLYTSLDGTLLVQFNSQWLPLDVFEMVSANPGTANLSTAHDYYKRYVQLRYLKRHLVIPAFLAIFLGVMYIVGKLLAAGIGRFFWHQFESLINRLPIIRNVYSSVKQVTDFAFSETDVQFTRVVAVEYPRRGIWSIGFVTGESMLDIRRAAGEPVLSVLMPTSPMPATGFTISIPKSETVDLDITIDQAIQYCVSCGVVVPDHQSAKSAIEGEFQKKNQNKAQLENDASGDD